jgi:hypothetical protein
VKSEWRTGALVVDTETGRTGRVMDSVGPYLQLRPPGGGREWDADPNRVRPADAAERQRAYVVELRLTSQGQDT